MLAYLCGGIEEIWNANICSNIDGAKTLFCQEEL